MVTLRAAACAGEAALDLALLRIGILAPADLGEISALLTRPESSLRPSCNADGHRIVEISERGSLFAQVHHDGRVWLAAGAGCAA